MIIISDCLTGKIDEGCLKVANSLTKRMKKVNPSTTIVSYDRRPDYSDIHLSLNKLFLDKKLFSIIKKKNEPVLYIPFASNTTASCIRTFILSVFSGRRCNVLFVLRFPMNRLAKFMLKLSGAKVIALSQASFEFYKRVVGEKSIYLKTGIDTDKFVPVSFEQKNELRKKYCIPEGKKVLLHVGHLKGGRNIDKLVNVSNQYHIILVVSSVTEAEKDAGIRKQLETRGNVTIIDSYLENIQEVYQMADLYLFPVQEVENCIDIPLSVLEAASCNIPIVTTEYGELSAFKGNEGFLFIDDLSKAALNNAIDLMAATVTTSNREAVNEYDWKKSIDTLQKVL